MHSSAFKLFLISFLLFSVSATAVGYLIYKQEQKGGEVSTRLADLKAWDELVAVQDDLADSSDGMEGLQAKLRSFVLLSESDTIEFLSVVEGTAKAVGAEIATVGLEEEKASDPDFKELEATFSLRRPTEAVERAIKALEVLPYRSRVETLTLTRGDSTSEASVVLRVSLIK